MIINYEKTHIKNYLPNLLYHPLTPNKVFFLYNWKKNPLIMSLCDSTSIITNYFILFFFERIITNYFKIDTYIYNINMNFKYSKKFKKCIDKYYNLNPI